MNLSEGIRRAARELKQLEKARQTWDFRSFERSRNGLAERVKDIADTCAHELEEVGEEVDAAREEVLSRRYPEGLEMALRSAGLPLEGGFPAYEIRPFRLEVVPAEEVRLRFGRRVEKSTFFKPEAIADWVGKRYRRLTGRPFDSRRFFRDLLGAYEVGNRLAYGAEKGHLLWDKPVALDQIWRLLTLRSMARTEYPREHFAYDIGRFRHTDLSDDRHKMGFGFSRDQGRAMVVIDPESGREDRLSSLTVYRKER